MTEARGGDGANQHGGPIAYMARNGVAANLLMVGILAAGLLSLGSLDQEVLPEHSLDRIQVSVPYPGASPVEVDESIVSRIEERIRSIEGVRSVTSVASEGLGSVVAELRRSADADRAREEIKAVVDGIQAFPAGAERPAVAEMTSRRSVMRIALHGDVQERTLKEYPCQADAVFLCRDLPRGVSRDGSVAVSASPRLDHP